jgi:hypothetical protein
MVILTADTPAHLHAIKPESDAIKYDNEAIAFMKKPHSVCNFFTFEGRTV